MANPDVLFCGRQVSEKDLDLIRQLTADFSKLTLHELASTVCELLDWRRPNGQLKTRECFAFMQRLMQQGGVGSIPALLRTAPRRSRSVSIDSRSDPQPPVSGDLGDHLPIQLRLIDDKAERLLFQQYIHRYHYLGYRTPYGAQLRYFVYSSQSSRPCLACLLFTSAAWKMAPRDQWIGWDDAFRRTHLNRLINHSRFLILPWVRIPDFASHLLSRVVHQLPRDWWTHYQIQPLLLETLVDVSRFEGTCYRAANWIDLGLTQGRGRMDRHRRALGRAPKRIFVYPLCRNARQLLSGPTLAKEESHWIY
jgi:Domain of unknown function (DUF4338)